MISKIINPSDKEYYNNLYEISLDFWSLDLVYANDEQQALEILVAHFVKNDFIGCLYKPDDLEEEIKENYIYIDCGEYYQNEEKGWCFYLNPDYLSIKEK